MSTEIPPRDRQYYSEYKDKVVLLTGIGQVGLDDTLYGNGAATALLMARLGAKIFGCDKSLEQAEFTKNRLAKEGLYIDIMIADATKEKDIKNLVDACMAKHGRIDILVNNVGESQPGGPAEMTPDVWKSQTDVNLTSVYLTCHFVLPIMEKQGSGVVINVASVAGIRYIGKPQVAYAATKAAVIQLTATTAVLYAKKGVRVNCVVPGLMATSLLKKLADKYAGGDVEWLSKTRDNQVPTGKQGSAFDIAETNLFLASNSAKYITGASIVVDGAITKSTGRL